MLKGTSYICLIAKFWFLWDRGSRGAVIGPSHQNYGLVFHKQSFCIATSARFGNAAKKMRSVTAPSQRPYFGIIYGQPGLCSSCSPLKAFTFLLTCPHDQVIIYSSRVFTGRFIRDFTLLLLVLSQSSSFISSFFHCLVGCKPYTHHWKKKFWYWYEYMRFEYISNQSTFITRSFEFAVQKKGYE